MLNDSFVFESLGLMITEDLLNHFFAEFFRRQANERFRMKYESVLEPGEEDVFLTPQEESTLRSIVTETGVRFNLQFDSCGFLFPKGGLRA